jgi:hypothetical protein
LAGDEDEKFEEITRAQELWLQFRSGANKHGLGNPVDEDLICRYAARLYIDGELHGGDYHDLLADLREHRFAEDAIQDVFEVLSNASGLLKAYDAERRGPPR